MVSGKTVSLQAKLGTANGMINAVSFAPGAPAVRLVGGTAISSTVRGVATFANLKVFQSAYTKRYSINGIFQNPNGVLAAGRTASSLFRVLPYQFLVVGSTFAGAQQRAFNTLVVQSARGSVRLVNIESGSSGLKTNQLKIQAYDYVSGSENARNVVVRLEPRTP